MQMCVPLAAFYFDGTKHLTRSDEERTRLSGLRFKGGYDTDHIGSVAMKQSY